MNNFRAFLVLLTYVNTYLNVRAFYLIAESLSYIVEQSCSSCQICVNAKL